MIKSIVLVLLFAITNPSPALPNREGVRSPSYWDDRRFGGLAHAFHTSLTEMKYNAKEKSMEISIRMFTDDLELALTKANNGQKIFIGGKNDNSEAILSKYVQLYFAIVTPLKQKKAVNFIGKEIEGDATWVYIEMPDFQDPKGHFIYNSLMQEMFDDQTNLVNLQYLGTKKTFLFDGKKNRLK